jgi:putative peptide zinc metalloprotease protein
MGLRVRLRADVQLSRGLLRGPTVVHRVRDPLNGHTFEVGVREHFVMSRLDGTRTVGDIGDEYGKAFGRRLAESHWHQLLGLLGQRGLLAVPGGDASVAPASGSRAVLAVEALHRLAPNGRPGLYASLLALALTTVVFLTWQVGALMDHAGSLVHDPPALLAALGVIWISAAAHELGHGVAALRNGCRVTSINLVAPHCRLDGYPYLRSVRAQLLIAGSGGVVNALVMIPPAVAWAMLPATAELRPWLGGVLLLGLVQAVVNYIPLPPLDGYRMLGHALRTADLAPSSLTFLRTAVTHPSGIAAYPLRVRLIYTAYGLFAAFAVVAGMLAGLLLASRGWLGVVAIVAVSMTVAGWAARRVRTRRPARPTNREGETDDNQ